MHESKDKTPITRHSPDHEIMLTDFLDIMIDGKLVKFKITKVPGYEEMVKGARPAPDVKPGDLKHDWDEVRILRLTDGRLMVCLTKHYESGNWEIRKIDGEIVFEMEPVASE